VSSSGHLIIVPELLGWDNPFIDSLAFSVMLHIATLVALLAYFRADWRRLVPAGLAALRDRSFRNDPDRRLAWLLAATTIPAIIVGLVLDEPIATVFREARLVAITLVVGAAILWLADRWGSHGRRIDEIGLGTALAIGVAQSVALVPGISRSGISISAGLFAGLSREAAARFSFLMATPITALAGAWEVRKLVTGEAGVTVEAAPLIVGTLAALVSGLAAIAVLLRFLRTNSLAVFIVYRVALAAVIVAWWLNVG
jgi:undecaprenyl-diphosphatase